MIKLIIFDFGGVISKVHSFKPFVLKKCKEKNLNPEKIVNDWYNSAGFYMKKASKGEINPDKFYDESAKIFSENPLEHRKEMLKYLRHYDSQMISLIRKIREKNLKICILSNIVPGHLDIFFEECQCRELFDEIFESWKISALKPSRKAFEIVLEHYSIEPENCLFVDDQQRNCNTAKSMGLNTFKYNNFNEFEEFISQLIEL